MNNYEFLSRMARSCCDPKDYSRSLAKFIANKTAIASELAQTLLQIYRYGGVDDETVFPRDYWFRPVLVTAVEINGSRDIQDNMYVTAKDFATAISGLIDEDNAKEVELLFSKADYTSTIGQLKEAFRESDVLLGNIEMPYDCKVGESDVTTRLIDLSLPDETVVERANFPTVKVDVLDTLKILMQNDQDNKLMISLFQLMGTRNSLNLAEVRDYLATSVGSSADDTMQRGKQYVDIVTDENISIENRIKMLASSVLDECSDDDLDSGDVVYDDTEFQATFVSSDYTGQSASAMWKSGDIGQKFLTALQTVGKIVKAAAKVVLTAVKAVFGVFKRLWRKFITPAFVSKDFVKSEMDTREKHCDVPLFLLGDETSGVPFSKDVLARLVKQSLETQVEKSLNFNPHLEVTFNSNGDPVFKATGGTDFVSIVETSDSGNGTQVVETFDVICGGTTYCSDDHDANKHEFVSSFQVQDRNGAYITGGNDFIISTDTLYPPIDRTFPVKMMWISRPDIAWSNKHGFTGSLAVDTSDVSVDVSFCPSTKVTTAPGLPPRSGISQIDDKIRQNFSDGDNPRYVMIKDAKNQLMGMFICSTDGSFNNGGTDGMGTGSFESHSKYDDDAEIYTWPIGPGTLRLSIKILTEHGFYPDYEHWGKSNEILGFVVNVIGMNGLDFNLTHNNVYGGDGDFRLFNPNVDSGAFLNDKGLAAHNFIIKIDTSSYEDYQIRKDVDSLNRAVCVLRVKQFGLWHEHRVVFDQREHDRLVHGLTFDGTHFNENDRCHVTHTTNINKINVVITHRAKQDDVIWVTQMGTYDPLSKSFINGLVNRYSQEERYPSGALRAAWQSDRICKWCALPLSDLSQQTISDMLGEISNPIDNGCALVLRYGFVNLQLMQRDGSIRMTAYLCPVDYKPLFTEDGEFKFGYSNGKYIHTELGELSEENFVDTLLSKIEASLQYNDSYKDEEGDLLAYKNMYAAYELTNILLSAVVSPAAPVSAAFSARVLRRKTWIKNGEVNNNQFVNLIFTDSISSNEVQSVLYGILNVIVGNKPGYMRVYYNLFGSFPEFIPYYIGEPLSYPLWHISTDEEIQNYVDKVVNAVIVAALVIAAAIVIGTAALKIKKAMRIKMQKVKQKSSDTSWAITNNNETIRQNQRAILEQEKVIQDNPNNESIKNQAQAIINRLRDENDDLSKDSANLSKLLYKQNRSARRWNVLAKALGVPDSQINGNLVSELDAKQFDVQIDENEAVDISGLEQSSKQLTDLTNACLLAVNNVNTNVNTNQEVNVEAVNGLVTTLGLLSEKLVNIRDNLGSKKIPVTWDR